TVRATVPLIQEKLEKFSAYPDRVRFLFEPVSPDGADPEVCRAAADALAALGEWETPAIEQTLRELSDRLGQKPAPTFAPIRLAITGTNVSPPLFESIELLGREESLARLRAAV